jgi:hypothetical protein
MNGPQHYRTAERLLRTCTDPDGGIYTATFEQLTAAVAHATLAQVAAMVFVAKAGITDTTAGEMSVWDKAIVPAKRRES